MTAHATSLVLAREEHAKLLRSALPGRVAVMKTPDKLRAQLARVPAVVFVDVDRIAELGAIDAPVIAILDSKPAETLPTIVHLLVAHPWLSHVVVASILSAPHARAHLTALLERFTQGVEQPLLGPGSTGRVALLATASHRGVRFERMREFFTRFALSERTIEALLDVAEELVMNALYDAPAEAGFFHAPRERIEDVELPPELACEISYGMEDGAAFVRLRDPFGALSRGRLCEVLTRCAGDHEVTLDESRGGAGLGLWRVFSAASTIAITVIPGSLTEIFVSVRIREGRGAHKHLQAVHLFFTAKSEEYEAYSLLPTDDLGLVDQSITLTRVA